MLDEWANDLLTGLNPAFAGARQIRLFVERHGRLVPIGNPSDSEIASASMLMASVNIRLPTLHGYLSASIPGAFRLRLLEHADRGAILVAPIPVEGQYVGLAVIESAPGRDFSNIDLARLEAVIGRFHFSRSRRLE